MAAAVPPMTRANLIGALKTLGWNPRDEASLQAAIADFQRGWNLGDPLLVDGKNGPRTRVAIRTSLARRKAGQPDASAHFSFAEFACTCRGRYPSCRRIRVHRALLEALEAYRSVVGPVSVVSGYRCPARNKAVGGATSSQHVYGAAADIARQAKTSVLARLRRFSGIGYQASSGLVQHVDVRHLSGNNTTGGTPDRPTTWRYA